MSNYHFILDYETLGQDTQKCALIDCSYYVFDWDRFIDNPYTFKELVGEIKRSKFDVQHQVKNLGFTIDKKTIGWWEQQGPAARAKIKPSIDDITIYTYLDDLASYLGLYSSIRYWWSRSNTFDPIILWRLTNTWNNGRQITDRLHWRKIRDTRTFIDAKTNFSLKQNAFCPIEDNVAWEHVFEQHNSIHDVAADILRLQTMIRIERDLDGSKIG